MDRIERAICNTMQATLKRYGFELCKDWGYFVRNQGYGHDAFLVVNQGTAKGRFFEIKCYVEVRHDRIEIPWNTLGMVYGEDNQRQTWTLNWRPPLGQDAVPMHVVPESMNEDAARIGQELSNVFEQRALPFYQRFGDLAEVEEWVNKKPLADTNPSAGGPIEHLAMRSLLLAKAVNPQRYAAVREAFIQMDKGMFPRERRIQMLQKVDSMLLSAE
ncbi:hypothetical protein ACFIQF_01665 [Comamonas sp. J-3]|uniref:hypothetical protein n=1 Tax=Comamonas trifloxystrobinivorans TaxID=3350256 RepID=UPI00372A19E4